MKRWLAGLLLLLLLAGCTGLPQTSPTIPPVSANPTAVSSPPSPSNVPAIMLNPAVTQATIGQTICLAGWTKTIRPTLPTRRGYENDHIVSLELGGSPANPANLRFVPLTRARRDDVLENQLHKQVCAHPAQLSLTQAQEQIIAAKRGE